MVLYPSGHFTALSREIISHGGKVWRWDNRMEHDKAKYSKISPSSDHKMAKLGELESNLTTKGGKTTRREITTADVTHSWLLFWLCCLKTVRNKCFKYNTPTQLNFYKSPAHILSEPEQKKLLFSREQADVGTTTSAVAAVILKLVPDNTSRPPFACFALPLCTDAQMAAASSSLCSQMTLTQELNWPLFLRGCSLDTTCVCRRDNRGNAVAHKILLPRLLVPCACVRDRQPPNSTAVRVKRSGSSLPPPFFFFWGRLEADKSAKPPKLPVRQSR